jgi:hypothetical protein
MFYLSIYFGGQVPNSNMKKMNKKKIKLLHIVDQP